MSDMGVQQEELAGEAGDCADGMFVATPQGVLGLDALAGTLQTICPPYMGS
jgi:hypothetical protein